MLLSLSGHDNTSDRMGSFNAADPELDEQESRWDEATKRSVVYVKRRWLKDFTKELNSRNLPTITMQDLRPASSGKSQDKSRPTTAASSIDGDEEVMVFRDELDRAMASLPGHVSLVMQTRSFNQVPLYLEP